MKNIFFFFTFIFPYTNQLSCWTGCRNFKFTKDTPFKDPLTIQGNMGCKRGREAMRCYGRILVYYDLELISYSLGPQEHIIEKEMERLFNINQLRFLIYFLFILESQETAKLVITAFILCQTHDNCALDYIKDLFHLYQKQENPLDELYLFFRKDRFIGKLSCYDYKSKQSIECIPSEYPRCIVHNTNRGCYSDPNRHIEYVFMITSKSTSIEKIHQLIICDTDNCNDKLAINNIENIIYNHTFGTMFVINKSNSIYLDQMFKFFLMIFYMIF
jgi:hypothetical protein